MEFTPLNNTIHLHFQCSFNMTIEQICNDINEYIFEHKNELYTDKTDVPIYFKRYTLIRSDSVWDK